MAVTLTLQTVNDTSVVICTDNTGQASIALDYSPFFERIASSLETVSTNVSTASAGVGSIASNLGSIENWIHELSVQASSEGGGVRTVSPYEEFSSITLYRYMVLQGKILDTSKNVSIAEQAKAAAKVPELMATVKNLVNSSQ